MGSWKLRLPSIGAPRIVWIGLCIAALGFAALAILAGLVAAIAPSLRPLFALAIVCIPLLLLISLRYPLLFFGLYAGFVPFENLKLLSGSVTITRCIALVAALSIMLALLVRRRIEPGARPLLQWGAVFAWMFLSVMWCINRDDALATLLQELQLFALYVLVALMPIRRKELWTLFGMIICAGALSALLNIKAYAGYHPVGLQTGFVMGSDPTKSARQWAGAAGDDPLDPNNYAAALLAPAVLLLMTLLQEQRWIRKCLLLGLFLTVIFGILTTSSRGALTALGVVVVYLMLRSRYKRQLTFIGGIGFMVTLALPALWSRIFDPTQGNGSGRFEIWAVAWEAFKRHWLFGAGVGNFPAAFGEAFREAYQTPSYMTSPDMMSHNLIAGQAVELGVVGLALMLLAWWIQWRVLAQIPRWSRLYDVRVALEALLLALFVESMFLDTMMRKYIWLAFSLVALTLTVWRHSEELHTSLE